MYGSFNENGFLIYPPSPAPAGPVYEEENPGHLPLAMIAERCETLGRQMAAERGMTWEGSDYLEIDY